MQGGSLIKTAGIKPDVATKLWNMTIKEIGRMQDLEKHTDQQKRTWLQDNGKQSRILRQTHPDELCH